MILNLGEEFVNYEGKDNDGHNMLLFSSVGCGYGLNPDFIKILFDRGASVMARGNRGESCLHLALQLVRCPEKSSEKDSLLLLVKAGADVYATDYSGMSVSYVAINSSDWKRGFNLGAYRRDLWDEVLTECGYDPASVHGRVQELEEVSDSDERESMIEEQDYKMDRQDFKDTENTSVIITKDAKIQYTSSSPVGDGLQLPGVMEETLDANIWSQTDLCRKTASMVDFYRQ